MTRFAFVVHPISVRDVARKYPIARYLPESFVEKLLPGVKPKVASEVKGIRSITGAETEGIFIGLPLTPALFNKLPLEFVYDRITQCAELAEKEGCEIIGLGAFTSVVGDGGVTVANRSKIAVTTGNSYTVATAIEGALIACDRLELNRGESVLAVVGATGSIGKTCAQVMAPEFKETIVVGRDEKRTSDLAATLPNARATVDIEEIRHADVIVTVTSSDTSVIQPHHLKSGAIVCDVARPRDVSVRVVKERSDVLVIEGGVVRVPGSPDFGLNFGFPPGTAYACMSETFMLALEGRAESFTLGKDVTAAQVEETQRLAQKHGFSLEGFRAFERAVDDEAINRVRAARVRLAPA